jgi:uncharacterized protein YciI
MHYVLFYEKAPDHKEREGSHLAAHRDYVRAALVRGELILGGPLENPSDGDNLLLFTGDSPSVAEDFARADPYVQAGIVCRWHVRLWRTVVGPTAASPLPEFQIKPA